MFSIEQFKDSHNTEKHRDFQSLHSALKESAMKREIFRKTRRGKSFDVLSPEDPRELLEKILQRMKTLEEEKASFMRQAYTCNKTNILNNNFFEEFKKRFQDRKKTKGNLYFFYLDLNKFKEINDTFGHKVGDEVLIEFSRRLTKVVRKNDIEDFENKFDDNFFVRMGGDEFIGKFELEKEQDALALRERLETLMLEPIVTSKGRLVVTASIGYQRIEEGQKLEEALERADMKMYENKNKNKNNR